MYRRVHTAEMLYLFPCFQDLSTCGGPEQGLGLLLLERFDFQPSPAQLEYCESRPNACKAEARRLYINYEDTGPFFRSQTSLTTKRV
jgi:hypothetical protein